MFVTKHHPFSLYLSGKARKTELREATNPLYGVLTYPKNTRVFFTLNLCCHAFVISGVAMSFYSLPVAQSFMCVFESQTLISVVCLPSGSVNENKMILFQIDLFLRCYISQCTSRHQKYISPFTYWNTYQSLKMTSLTFAHLMIINNRNTFSSQQCLIRLKIYV